MNSLKAPKFPWTMTTSFFLRVYPNVHRNLREWAEQAGRIPDTELRKQALMSIKNKKFHCEGGAVYGLLAGGGYREAIRFIVAYQTISDYLDNLCDRSTSSDPDDFRALHESMLHALTPNAPCKPYYRFRKEQNDGAYLNKLVKTCQDILEKLPGYKKIAPFLHELSGYYCGMQVHKHIRVEERVSRLKNWFEGHKERVPAMHWFEFSACSGSTLGIFCLVSYAFHENCSTELAGKIKAAYFPWVQGLHILLDYLIDQDEDTTWGDLNFCSHYHNDHELESRLRHFYKQADNSVACLPDGSFHRMVNRGLLAFYFSDRKVFQQKNVWEMAKKMICHGGPDAWFFFVQCLIFRWITESKSEQT
jgi:tetraprenyl-beta-curcumene synthase